MEEIRSQLIFLLGSFLSGVFVMLAYEVVNIFRGLFRPGVIGRLFMDVIFFVLSGVCVFQMIFSCNNGTIRSFFVFAFGIGAILYRKTVGTLLSDLFVKAVKKIGYLISRPFVLLCRKMRKKKKAGEEENKKSS